MSEKWDRHFLGIIAVAVDATGDWNCCGWRVKTSVSSKERQQAEQEMMSLASENVETGEARYWLEAELDAPTIAIVQAEAKREDA